MRNRERRNEMNVIGVTSSYEFILASGFEYNFLTFIMCMMTIAQVIRTPQHGVQGLINEQLTLTITFSFGASGMTKFSKEPVFEVGGVF
jgi:hypothetical protein